MQNNYSHLLDNLPSSGIIVLEQENMSVIDLKKQYSKFTVRAILVTIIQHYGAGDKLFHWNNQTWTPLRALNEWGDYLLNTECGTFGVIRFYGGPPKKCTWYNGTILTMLLDLILFSTATKAWALKDKLETQSLHIV